MVSHNLDSMGDHFGRRIPPGNSKKEIVIMMSVVRGTAVQLPQNAARCQVSGSLLLLAKVVVRRSGCASGISAIVGPVSIPWNCRGGETILE